MATKKATATKRAAKGKSDAPKSMPKSGKNPKGGLTAEGRAYFNKKEGSHLKPGVTGAADTPEKMMRKGSFLRRHFTHPRGPMQDDKGRPTRLALSAHAWGEPVPKDMAAAKKLADKGHALLEKYHALQDKASAKKSSAKKIAKKTPAKKSTAKKASSTTSHKARPAAKKATAKRAARTS